MINDNSTQVFFALLKAGLWNRDVCLLPLGSIDYNVVYRLAEEQSVIGLVAGGIENVVDVKMPQQLALQFAGMTLQLEQRNTAMNEFIAMLVQKLREHDIYALLVKGQGIAQCYKRPLWRACGDVDLFLDENNYHKAVDLLTPLSDKVVDNTIETKHYSMIFGQWEVELHGTLHCQISKRIDRVVDIIQENTFCNKEVRVWHNGETDIYLPAPDNDIVFVFIHILQHFYLSGIGLRQLCDLVRLLWCFKGEIDKPLLKKRLSEMGVMNEWRAFGCVLVDVLGLEKDAMPFYDKAYSNKTKRILSYILDVGNFGHKKDNSYQSKDIVIIRKMKTFILQAGESLRIMQIFPQNAIVSLLNYWMVGLKNLLNNSNTHGL